MCWKPKVSAKKATEKSNLLFHKPLSSTTSTPIMAQRCASHCCSAADSEQAKPISSETGFATFSACRPAGSMVSQCECWDVQDLLRYDAYKCGKSFVNDFFLFFSFYGTVSLVAKCLNSWTWCRGNLARLLLDCDSASRFAASDRCLLLLRLTTVAACPRVL